MPERNRYLPGLVAYSSGPIASVKVNRASRLHGESRVGLWGLIQLATTALLSFSNLPIRLVSFFGLFCSASALIAGVSFIAVKLFTTLAIPGWASMMTAIAFASGVQLLCLGLMGEYVARIYEEVKRRPLYLVDGIYQSPIQNSRATLNATSETRSTTSPACTSFSEPLPTPT